MNEKYSESKNASVSMISKHYRKAGSGETVNEFQFITCMSQLDFKNKIGSFSFLSMTDPFNPEKDLE
jgi:hypothetical protein